MLQPKHKLNKFGGVRRGRHDPICTTCNDEEPPKKRQRSQIHNSQAQSASRDSLHAISCDNLEVFADRRDQEAFMSIYTTLLQIQWMKIYNIHMRFSILQFIANYATGNIVLCNQFCIQNRELLIMNDY